MQKFTLLFLLLGTLSADTILAQDTLPYFTVKNFGQKRIVVSWKNNFPIVKQIGIQRSYDSLRFYKTILTVADPMLPENGYFDTKALTDSMFYRLFIVLDKGEFIFTEPLKPVLDTIKQIVFDLNGNIDGRANILDNKSINGDQRYKDIIFKSTDSLVIFSRIDSAELARLEKKQNIFIPSLFVFSQRDGYIQISLPEAGSKSYSIKFYEEDDRLLFEMKDIYNSSFKIDKTSFYHSGWFKFELFEENKLIEKSKFFLAKDF